MKSLRSLLNRSVIIALLVVLTAGPVAAGHGTWNHHDLHWGESGPSQYWSYADIGATNNVDFVYAQWQRWTTRWTWLDGESISCTGSCGYKKTPTRYFPQTAYIIRGISCAKDGSHEFPSSGQWIWDCTAVQQLYAHVHAATTN